MTPPITGPDAAPAELNIENTPIARPRSAEGNTSVISAMPTAAAAALALGRRGRWRTAAVSGGARFDTSGALAGAVNFRKAV